jgi:hypothetical protein
VPGRFKGVKQLPLPDDFLVAGHEGILLGLRSLVLVSSPLP